MISIYRFEAPFVSIDFIHPMPHLSLNELNFPIADGGTARSTGVDKAPQYRPWPCPRVHSAAVLVACTSLNDAEEADFAAKIAKANAAALAAAQAAAEKVRCRAVYTARVSCGE